MEVAYKYKGAEHKGILPSVKEVDSNDSSVMSNQIRRNQNRYSSQYDKHQQTQNYSSTERKDSQVFQNSDENQLGKQEFTSSSKSGDIQSNPGFQLLKLTQQSQRNESEQIHNISDDILNDNMMQQKNGAQQFTNSPMQFQQIESNMNGFAQSDNQNNQQSSQGGQLAAQQKNLSGTVTSQNGQDYIQTSTEIMFKDNLMSQATIPSQQGSAIVLLNDNPNFLASHSPLVIKKVRPSQWNNIPLMNLEQCESNTNFNIQDISVIHKNPSGSDHPSPQKEEILTKSEFLIYQCLPSPPNQLYKENSLQLNSNKVLVSQSDPSSPTRHQYSNQQQNQIQNQSQNLNLNININQIRKSQSNQSPDHQHVQLTSNFLDFSNSPNNNSSNIPQGVISTFKDQLSPSKQNDIMKQQHYQLLKSYTNQQSNQNTGSPSSGTNQNNSNLPLPTLNPQASLYSFAASPSHFRSSVQLQQQQQQLITQINNNQVVDQNQIQSLQHINQNSNFNSNLGQLSSQLGRTNENVDISPQGKGNSNLQQSLKISSISGTNKSIQSQQDVNQYQNELIQSLQFQQQNPQQNLDLYNKNDGQNQDKNIQSSPIKNEKGKRDQQDGPQVFSLRKSIVSASTQITSPKSDYKQREELAYNDSKRSSALLQQQYQNQLQQYQDEFNPNQQHEIYSFNMKNNNTHTENSNSEQISPTTISDSQPILVLNKQISTNSNITGQFKEGSSMNHISDLQSSSRLDFPKQDQVLQQDTNKLTSSQTQSRYKLSHFSSPYVLSEVNQKALTRSTTSSVRGDKFILAKSLQVKITKFYSDETVEVFFEGNYGIFMKKDFIFLKENSSKKDDEKQNLHQNTTQKRKSSATKGQNNQPMQNKSNSRSASLYLPQSSRLNYSPPHNKNHIQNNKQLINNQKKI